MYSATLFPANYLSVSKIYKETNDCVIWLEKVFILYVGRLLKDRGKIILDLNFSVKCYWKPVVADQDHPKDKGMKKDVMFFYGTQQMCHTH